VLPMQVMTQRGELSAAAFGAAPLPPACLGGQQATLNEALSLRPNSSGTMAAGALAATPPRGGFVVEPPHGGSGILDGMTAKEVSTGPLEESLRQELFWCGKRR